MAGDGRCEPVPCGECSPRPSAVVTIHPQTMNRLPKILLSAAIVCGSALAGYYAVQKFSARPPAPTELREWRIGLTG